MKKFKKHIYGYRRAKDGKLSSKMPIMTIVYGVDENGIITGGMSVCSQSEMPSRKTGLVKAEGRQMSAAKRFSPNTYGPHCADVFGIPARLPYKATFIISMQDYKFIKELADKKVVSFVVAAESEQAIIASNFLFRKRFMGMYYTPESVVQFFFERVIPNESEKCD